MSLSWLDILFIGLFCSLFVLLVSLCNSANLPNEERHRQWPLPIVAILYGAFLVWRFEQMHAVLMGVYSWVVERFPWASLLNASVFIVCVFNLLGIALFVSAKGGVLVPVSRTSERGQDALLRPIYNVVYYFDQDEKKWLLRMRYLELRKAIKWMHRVAMVLALLLLIASFLFNESPAFANPFYPVFPILILGEVRYYFEGLTAPEYVELIGVDSEEAERVHDYLALQKAAADLLPDRFLESHIRQARQVSAVTNKEFIEQLLSSGCYEERLAGEYVNAVYTAMVNFFSKMNLDLNEDEDEDRTIGRSLFEEEGFNDVFRIEVDQVRAMIKLLKHENLIFATPFFLDYREFFFFPVNRELMRGDRVLVLDCQGGMDEKIASWIGKGLHTASSVYELWTVGGLTKSSLEPEPDVGIVSISCLNDFRFLEAHRDFFANVGFVILLHPSCAMGMTQIGFSRLSHIMRDPETITFTAFDMNVDGLVDSLSHALRAQFVQVSAMSGLSMLNCGMHWQAEGDDTSSRVFKDASHYLGVGTELAAISLRMGAQHIEWSAHSAIPIKDMRWISNQYYRNIAGYAGVECSQDALEKALHLNEGLWNTPVCENGYFIVEDEFCNLLEMQRQYSTRGSVSSFVHVISGNYLLRDFMRYNARVLLGDPRAVSLVVADYQRSLRNYLIELLATLILQDVDVVEVSSRLQMLGIEVEPDKAFGYCIGSKDIPGKIDEFGLIPDSRSYRYIACKTIAEDKGIRTVLYVCSEESRSELTAFLTYLHHAHYIAEDEIEGGKLLGSCLFGQVQQRYLPGQLITLQGKYYEVLSVSPDSGMLLRRAGDHFERRLYYRQVKRFSIGCCQDSFEAVELADDSAVQEFGLRKRLVQHENTTVEFALITADITVDTIGYLRMVDYADIEGSSFVEIDDDAVQPRMYLQKNVLRINFFGASDSQLITIAALLNELARTMYACDYEYISVAPALSRPVDSFEQLGLRGVVQPLVAQDETVLTPSLYVIEDSFIDIGLVSSFERNIERFLAIIQCFLSWHSSMLKKGPVLDNEDRHFISPEHLFGNPDRYSDDGISGIDENHSSSDDEIEIEFIEPPTTQGVSSDDRGIWDDDSQGLSFGENGFNGHDIACLTPDNHEPVHDSVVESGGIEMSLLSDLAEGQA